MQIMEEEMTRRQRLLRQPEKALDSALGAELRVRVECDRVKVMLCRERQDWGWWWCRFHAASTANVEVARAAVQAFAASSDTLMAQVTLIHVA